MKSLILNMDTSMPLASICLSENGLPGVIMKNESQKDHAAWLHPAIEQLLRETGHTLKDLDAIAVTEGPGSYTGLRVAMAAAKGFCFILNKPLILVNTLQVMAFSAIRSTTAENGTLYCPMIDARRMEVFTGLYDTQLAEVKPPSAVILNDEFDRQLPVDRKVIVFGSGSHKYQGRQEVVKGIVCDASHLAVIAATRFRQKTFTSAEKAVPFYGKAFFTPPVK